MWYRGELVKDKLRMQWQRGVFWPIINGRLRR
jgi:hypothetical protein